MYPNYTHEGDRVKIPAGSAVVKNEMVKLSSNTVVPMTKGAALYGVALNSASTGEIVTVSKKGVYRFTAETAVDFNYGDVVYAYTSTTVYAGAAAELSIGTVVDTNPASAGEVNVRITPSDNAVVTHAS